MHLAFTAFIAGMCFIYLQSGLMEYINDREAGSWWALQNWREANPNCAIGDWPYAQKLVIDRIVIHEIWLVFNSIERDKTYVDWLISLLTETPPPPPPTKRRKRRPTFGGPESGLLFSYQKIPTLSNRDSSFYCFFVRVKKTTSCAVPKRCGGPQLPAPLVVYTHASPCGFNPKS